MIEPVYCNGCGKRLEIPAGFAKSKMRCADCGVFSEIPKEVREQGQITESATPTPAKRPSPAATDESTESDGYSFLNEPEPPPKAAPPVRVKSPEPEETDDESPEREVLIQGTHDDDLNPYTVTGDAPTKVCPSCEKRILARAKACVHCGHNFATGEKAKRTFEPVDKQWTNGWPFEKRLMLFVVFQVINFVTLVASQIQGFSFSVSFMLILMTIGFQAFLTGTYDVLTLTRTAKGKVTLTSAWRYAFIPRLPNTIKWKEHDTVTVVQTNEFDPVDWCMAFILLGYCVVPGVLFWYFVIRPDKFTIALCKDHGFPETPFFRTTDQERAREIQKIVSETTTLPIQK